VTRFEIFQKVEAENARSKEKYGMWQDCSEEKQYMAIRGEFKEWNDAHCKGDIHGEHGEIIEAIQTINVLCRRIQFLTGEADA
jgi:hypothetical protein